jgi:hypothetical protein
MPRSVAGLQATALVQAVQQMAKQSPHVRRVLVAVTDILFSIQISPSSSENHF